MNRILFFRGLILVLLAGSAVSLNAQTSDLTFEGTVSYVTSANVYVKFQDAEGPIVGDTIFLNEKGVQVPVLKITGTSSVSCICVPLGGRTFTTGDKLILKRKPTPQQKTEITQTAIPVQPERKTGDSISTTSGKPASGSPDIGGSISVASYLNFSNRAPGYQRMRYTLALHTGDNKSKLTAETYITFAHKINDWETVSQDLFNALKIYSLSVNYKFSPRHQLWFGRKINPRISSAGALDGLQYEFRTRGFTLGLVAGTRPDPGNYRFNATLPQAGAYVSHDLNGKNGSMQTTVAFMQQMNSGQTDRRFIYFQHVNTLAKHLYFFGSLEADLYNKTYHPEDSSLTSDNKPKLSNLYLSLRYRPIKELSLSVSYSERQNVIYYETYKDIVQTMLEAATVKGWVAQAQIFPVNNLSIGLQGSYRNSEKDSLPSKSFYGYLTFAKIPGLNAALTVSATLLETSYLSSGKIFSAGLYRDLVKGKVSGSIGYKYVDYRFLSGETASKQHMPEISFNWRILKKLSCTVYYEGTFEKISNFNRVYLTLTQRF